MTANASIVVAFLRRDWFAARTYRAAYAAQFAGAILTITVFFYISRVVGRSAALSPHSLRPGYFGYVIVGLAALQLVHAAVTSVASELREEQTTGTLEALLATPAPTPVVVLATYAFDLLRSIVLAAAMIGAAVALFGLTPGISWAGASALLLAVPAAIALFASLGVALAAATVLYKKTTGILALVTSGLGLLCGAYFPLGVFPPAVHAIADALPFTWAIQLIREVILTNTVDVGRLVALTVSAAVLLPLSLMLFNAAVGRARRLGTLGHY